MSKHLNMVAARDAGWALLAKHAASIKKEFIAGATGIKAIDAMDKDEREKGFALVEKGLRAKTNLADKAEATPKKAVKAAKVTKKAIAKKAAKKATGAGKVNSAASALTASLNE
jgi:hypothetical protein